jgi:hypothetical protein
MNIKPTKTTFSPKGAVGPNPKLKLQKQGHEVMRFSPGRGAKHSPLV